MNKRILLFAAAGALAVPSVAPAAIDDAGMKYVSAAEGLSGSVRIRMIDKEDTGQESIIQSDPRVRLDDTRIIYRGESDLGGALAATYFLEFRPEGGFSALSPEYLDAGMRGRFGHVRFGIIESVSEAIVPAADRTSDVGTSGRLLANDYDNGIRWVSPEINGMLLGISTETEDRDGSRTKKSFEQYDVALSYRHKGARVGAAYTVIPHPAETKTDDDDDKSGFRIGAVYAHDTWGIGYNLHRYSSDTDVIFASGLSTLGDVSWTELENHKDTEYVEHVISANWSIGRFGLAFAASKGTLENRSLDTADATPIIEPFEVEYRDYMLDIEYRYGSKARLVAAYEVHEVHGDNIQIGQEKRDKHKSKGYYLLYRVDF